MGWQQQGISMKPNLLDLGLEPGKPPCRPVTKEAPHSVPIVIDTGIILQKSERYLME